MVEGAIKPLIPSELIPALNPILVVDGSGLEKVRGYFSRVNVFGKDYETNIVPTFYNRRARTLQVGDRNEQYVIDLMAFAETRDRLIASQGGFWHNLPEDLKNVLRPVIDTVRPAFESNSHLKIGHNLTFEYTTSKWCLGMRPWHFYDTQIVEQVIECGNVNFKVTGYWGMEDLIRRYCLVEIDKTQQKQDWMKEEPLSETDLIYCALDCRLLFPIKNGQEKKIHAIGLAEAATIENDAIPGYGDMEINGFYMNPESWMKLIEENAIELKKAVSKLDEFFIPLVGEKLDPPSDEEIAKLEGEWRKLGEEKSTDELILIDAIKATKDKEEKDRLRALKLKAEEARKVLRDAARDRYKAVASTRTKTWLEAYGKMEGRAKINYNAGGQIAKALMGKFGFNEKNLPDTNDDTLEKHADKPVVAAIRDYRKYSKRKTTYGNQWILTTEQEHKKGKFGYIDPNTGRLHATIYQLGAETGRSSCSSPNLFNLPREDKYRACFEAQPGYKMATIDAAGQELCILADYAQEPVWTEAFQQGWDVHSICAEFFEPQKWRDSMVLVPYEFEKKGRIVKIPVCAFKLKKVKCSCPEHKDFRDKMKAVNFGVPYGLSKWALALQLGITVDEAEEMLSKHRAMFPTLWKWLDLMGEEGLRMLESRSRSNRRRKFRKVSWEQAKASAAEKDWVKEKMKKEGRTEPTQKETTKAYKGIQAAIKREAVNMKIQGTGADQMKKAMGCGFDKEGKPYFWHILEPLFGGLHVNFVYDEHVFEAPDQADAKVSPFVTQELDFTPVEFDNQTVSRNMKEAFEAVSDAMTRAGAEFVATVPMRTEGHIDTRWRK